MNHYSHPRPLHVLRRARRTLASNGHNGSAADHFSRRPTPPCDVSRSISDINATDRTPYGEIPHPPDSLGHIQNT
jgi:hypothetical protein